MPILHPHHRARPPRPPLTAPFICHAVCFAKNEYTNRVNPYMAGLTSSRWQRQLCGKVLSRADSEELLFKQSGVLARSGVSTSRGPRT